MNLRKLKKIAEPGNVLVVIGTHTAFLSIGGLKRTPNGFAPTTINGVDLKERVSIHRADGRARLATKKEAAAYWSIMRSITKSIAPGEKLEFIPKEK